MKYFLLLLIVVVTLFWILTTQEQKEYYKNELIHLKKKAKREFNKGKAKAEIAVDDVMDDIDDLV